jgi:hypothetical protein
MNRYPVKLGKRSLRKVDPDPVVVESASDAHPFFSFRYSYTEISALGDKARVKSRTASYENGKLAAESFEGELARDAYDRMLGDAQRYFLDQASFFLRAATAFLPALGKRRGDSD